MILINAALWLCQQVTMVDRGAAERACKDANPIIDGRKANVNLAYLGAKPRSSQTSKCVKHTQKCGVVVSISKAADMIHF